MSNSIAISDLSDNGVDDNGAIENESDITVTTIAPMKGSVTGRVYSLNGNSVLDASDNLLILTVDLLDGLTVVGTAETANELFDYLLTWKL
jgi:hypothetical protein